MKAVMLCLGALVSLSAVGCTTTATIRTNPPGANLFFGGRYMGKTPVTVELKDGLEAAAGTSARLELEGYRTQHVLLGKEWSPGYIALDILACIPTLGLACYLIYFNGKTHDSEYDFLMLEERRRGPPPAPAPPAPAAEARGVPVL